MTSLSTLLNIGIILGIFNLFGKFPEIGEEFISNELLILLCFASLYEINREFVSLWNLYLEKIKYLFYLLSVKTHNMLNFLLQL